MYVCVYIYILGVARYMYVHVTRSLQQFANTNRCIQILGVRQAAYQWHIKYDVGVICILMFFFVFFLHIQLNSAHTRGYVWQQNWNISIAF